MSKTKRGKYEGFGTVSINMKILFLGTNGWYDTDTGNTPCIFVQTENFYIVFDAGNGLYKLDRYVKEEKPICLFLSHFHLDHIEGLHTLLKFKFKNKMFICGPEGARKILGTIMRKPFTVPFKKLPYDVCVFELPKQTRNLPFKIKTLPLEHSTPVLGYRLEIDGRTITYCTDTGYCKNAVKLAKNADLLITECSYKSGEQNPGWSHLNPEIAANLAKKAKAKRLVLTHFDPSRYLNLHDRFVAEKKAKSIFKNSLAAFDGKIITL